MDEKIVVEPPKELAVKALLFDGAPTQQSVFESIRTIVTKVSTIEIPTTPTPGAPSTLPVVLAYLDSLKLLLHWPGLQYLPGGGLGGCMLEDHLLEIFFIKVMQSDHQDLKLFVAELCRDGRIPKQEMFQKALLSGCPTTALNKLVTLDGCFPNAAEAADYVRYNPKFWIFLTFARSIKESEDDTNLTYGLEEGTEPDRVALHVSLPKEKQKIFKLRGVSPSIPHFFIHYPR